MSWEGLYDLQRLHELLRLIDYVRYLESCEVRGCGPWVYSWSSSGTADAPPPWAQETCVRCGASRTPATPK